MEYPSLRQEYDVSEPVTRSLTLHVRYQAADDAEWQAARRKLMDQIAVAQALMNNTSVSEENRQIFKRRGGYMALEVVSRVYRPTLEELFTDL